jgi:predicted phosphohydrolase
MVKFQIISDIHIEQEGPLSCLDVLTPTEEILVMAGDIGRINKLEQLETFLTDVCKHFKIVVYVLGNHEYFKEKGSRKTMEELLQDIESVAKKLNNLYILNRSSIVVGDVCIAGCTLWSRPLIGVPSFIVRIKDMNTIKYNTLFNRDLDYVKGMIDYCQKNNLRLVMVTHYCPSPNLTRFSDKYTSLYATDLEYLFSDKKVHTWVYGHVHKNRDLIMPGGTRVVSNQRGKGENLLQDFKKNKVIEC